MKNFKGGRGGSRGGSKFGGKPSFNRGPSRGGRAGGPPELFDAVCSRCGKATLVPFRPNGKKPVFCRDCFSRENYENGGENNRSEFPPRKESPNRFDRDERPHDRPFDKHREPREDRQKPVHDTRFAGTISKPDPRIDELKRQLDRMDSKIDKLFQMFNSPSVQATEAVPEKIKIAKVSKTKKKTSK